MRSGRSFLILLVLALGLGAYIYFVESKRDPNAGETKPKVFAQNAGLIQEVELRSDTGVVTRVKRDGSSWSIVEPAALPADTAQVASLVSTLESIDIEKTVDENPASVASYGLEPPRFSVAFRREGESEMHRLNVGAKTATGADLYARVEGDPKLFLIGGYLENSLDKSTFDLRDKTALEFDRDAASELRLASKGVPDRTLVRQADTWRLTRPVQARADGIGVDGILSRLDQLQMKSIAAEDGTGDLAKYGLDTPQATATVVAGSATSTLAVGKKLDDDATSAYARDLSRPVVFTVDATILDELGRNTDALRTKDLFAFRSFNATQLDVTWKGRTATFRKATPPASADASAGPEVWTRTAPSAGDVDQTKMTDLLNSLSNLRAESYTDRAMTGGDEMVVVVHYGDAASPSEERVTFRKSDSAAQAIIQGEPGAALVNASTFDTIVSSLESLAGFQ